MKSNASRFYELLQRAKSGEDITIAFLGGSITQGSLSSAPETCYAYLVYEWWEKVFPKAKVHYVNAGIGGTNSLFGCARVWDDLLMYDPDFVVIDFSVNDMPEEFFRDTYQGLIHRIFTDASAPAILALGNIYYDTGISADQFHMPVCDMYEIPYVNVRNGLYESVVHGKIKREEISPDGLHPNDRGHAAVAKMITDFLLEWKRDTEEKVPAELFDGQKSIREAESNPFNNVRRYRIDNCRPKLFGFRIDTKENNGHLDLWSKGWIGTSPYDAIEFDLPGTEIALQYRKRPQGKSPKALCYLDDRSPVLLDGNFEERWGDCLYLQPILTGGEDVMHHIRIELADDSDSTEIFYLNAVITNR